MDGWTDGVIKVRASWGIGSNLGDFRGVLGASGREEPPKVRREACSY